MRFGNNCFRRDSLLEGITSYVCQCKLLHSKGPTACNEASPAVLHSLSTPGHNIQASNDRKSPGEFKNRIHLDAWHAALAINTFQHIRLVPLMVSCITQGDHTGCRCSLQHHHTYDFCALHLLRDTCNHTMYFTAHISTADMRQMWIASNNVGQ